MWIEAPESVWRSGSRLEMSCDLQPPTCCESTQLAERDCEPFNRTLLARPLRCRIGGGMGIGLRHYGDGTVGWLAEGRGLHPDFPGPRAVRARGLAERAGRALPRLGAGRPAEAVGGAGACPAGGPADGRRQRRVAGPVAWVSRQAAVVHPGGSRRGRGGSGARRGERPGAPGGGHAPSEGRRGLSRQAHPLLDPLVGASSWHHAARDTNIGRVVNNDRFLPLPWVPSQHPTSLQH